MTGDERRELQAVIVDLEAEEADQQVANCHAPPRLSRAIARLHQLKTSTDTVAVEDVSAARGSLRPGPSVAAPPR